MYRGVEVEGLVTSSLSLFPLSHPIYLSCTAPPAFRATGHARVLPENSTMALNLPNPDARFIEQEVAAHPHATFLYLACAARIAPREWNISKQKWNLSHRDPETDAPPKALNGVSGGYGAQGYLAHKKLRPPRPYSASTVKSRVRCRASMAHMIQ